MTTLTIIIGIVVLVGVGFYLSNKSERKNNNTSSGGGTDTTSNSDVNVN